MLREFQKEIEELRKKLEEGDFNLLSDFNKKDFMIINYNIASGSESEGGEVSGAEDGSGAAKRKKCMKRRGKRVTTNFYACFLQPKLFDCGLPLICPPDSAGPLSPRAAAALKVEIEKERAQLMATKDMAESEKNKAKDELSKREMELKSAQEQHEELNKKLQDLQSKVCLEYSSLASN